jgi:cation diffusion facilitator family transporter
MTLKAAEHDPEHGPLGVESRTVVASLILAIIVLGIKFAAYLLTNSSAIFGDALESVVVVLTGIFAVYATRLAHRPADSDHPYGHGKIEFLSSGLEGGMIVLTAVLVVARSAKALITGASVENLDWGMGIMFGTAVFTTIIGLWLIRRGRKMGTIVVDAEGQHWLGDGVTTLAAGVAVGGVRYLGWSWLDPVTAICVAVYLVWVAVQLLRRSAAGLMDEQDVADAAMLRGILDAHLPGGNKEPRICSYHKLRHRHSGRYHWVDFHIMVPRWWDIERGHKLASTIEYEIECAIGEGNATAHVEPCDDLACVHCVAEKKKSLAADVTENTESRTSV